MKISQLRQPKINKVKIFLPFLKFMKRHKPSFTQIPWGNSTLLGQKKAKFITRPNLSIGQLLLEHRFLIDILLKLQQQILICFC